jgi:mono/diheme cytochrome c family protein
MARKMGSVAPIFGYLLEIRSHVFQWQRLGDILASAREAIRTAAIFVGLMSPAGNLALALPVALVFALPIEAHAYTPTPSATGPGEVAPPAGSPPIGQITGSHDTVGLSVAAASAMVARGRYLTAAGDCISCHTRPGGAPFSGGRPFTTPFGTIYSSNITPDLPTGIGNWTRADLRLAMHEGIAPGGKRLFPAFPYPSFTKISDEDVDAIFAYLRTITPQRYVPPPNSFLLRQRWAMRFWNELFFTAGRFSPNPGQSSTWNRGAYLVGGLGHCGACHTPRNSFMAEIPNEAYTGGTFQDSVAPGKIRRWSSANLTSSKEGLAAWSLNQLARYLHTGFSLRAGTFGPMNEVIVNSLQHLSNDDIHAIATYLKSLPARQLPGADVPVSEMTAGKRIYRNRCEDCHQASGRGGMFEAPPLAGSAVVQATDPASLINIILYGPDQPKGISFGSWETMEPYDRVLTDAEVAAVSNYVRGSWGNRAGMVTPAAVAKQR